MRMKIIVLFLCAGLLIAGLMGCRKNDTPSAPDVSSPTKTNTTGPSSTITPDYSPTPTYTATRVTCESYSYFGYNEPTFYGTCAVYVYFSKYFLPEDGYIESITSNLYGPSEVQMGIYTDSGAAPGTRIVQSDSTAYNNNGWVTVSVSQTFLTGGTYYWLAAQLKSGGSQCYDSVIGGSMKNMSSTYGSLPLTFIQNNNSTDTQLEIYASYCRVPGAPTLTHTLSATVTYTETGTLSPTITPSQTISNTYTEVQTSTITLTPTITLVPTEIETPICGSPSIFGNNAGVNEGTCGIKIYASEFNLTETGIVMNIDVYQLGSGNGRAAIYSDSAGQPGTLLMQSEIQPGSEGWNTYEIPDTELVAGTYWLAIHTEGSFGNYIDDLEGVMYGMTYTFGTMPSTFSPTSGPNVFQLNIFARYCPLPPTETETPTFTITTTATVTLTPVPTGTITWTNTQTVTSTISPTATIAYTATVTPTITATLTPGE